MRNELQPLQVFSNNNKPHAYRLWKPQTPFRDLQICFEHVQVWYYMGTALYFLHKPEWIKIWLTEAYPAYRIRLSHTQAKPMLHISSIIYQDNNYF